MLLIMISIEGEDNKNILQLIKQRLLQDNVDRIIQK